MYLSINQSLYLHSKSLYFHIFFYSSIHPSTYIKSSVALSSVGWKKLCISKILNVQEGQKKHGCISTVMNETAFFLPCHNGSIFFFRLKFAIWTGQNLVSYKASTQAFKFSYLIPCISCLFCTWHTYLNAIFVYHFCVFIWIEINKRNETKLVS